MTYRQKILFSGLVLLCFFRMPFGFAETCTKIENSLRSEFAVQAQQIPKYKLTEQMSKYKIPGMSIAALNKGKLTCAKGYGVKELDKSDPVTLDTLFQAGSVSKPITALGALYLVDRGLIKLDEDVNHYLKSWKVPENEFTKKEKVTLRRLLSHTAGVTVHGFPGYDRNAPIPSLVQVLNGTKPLVNTDPIVVDTVPGSNWRYSGGGFTIIQLMIEDVTGVSFSKWMKETILNPLGMKASTFDNPLPESLHSLAPSGYGMDGKMVKGKWHVYPEKAAAGLWTTPSDLVKVLLFIEKTYYDDPNRTKLLSQKIIREMLTPKMNGVGLGLPVRETEDYIEFSHNGADEGFLTSWNGIISKKDKSYRGHVMMINTERTEGPIMDEVGRSIADTYSWPNSKVKWRSLFTDWKKTDLKPFLGKYRPSKGNPIITISEKNQHLHFQDNFLPTSIELLQTSNDSFFALLGADITFRFKDGKIDGIGVRFSGSKKEDVFPKVE